MRTQTIIFGFAILAICLVKNADSQDTTTTAAPATTTAAAGDTTTAAAGTDTTTPAAGAATTTPAAGGATTTPSTPSTGGNKNLLRRLRRLRRRLARCRKHAAAERAALLKKIAELSAGKNKFFG